MKSLSGTKTRVSIGHDDKTTNPGQLADTIVTSAREITCLCLRKTDTSFFPLVPTHRTSSRRSRATGPGLTVQLWLSSTTLHYELWKGLLEFRPWIPNLLRNAPSVTSFRYLGTKCDGGYSGRSGVNRKGPSPSSAVSRVVKR